jgi:hypothetical protein
MPRHVSSNSMFIFRRIKLYFTASGMSISVSGRAVHVVCFFLILLIMCFYYVSVFLLLFMFCSVFCFIVLFYVLFVCKCVLYYCHRVATQLQLTNIYHIISYHTISYAKLKHGVRKIYRTADIRIKPRC